MSPVHLSKDQVQEIGALLRASREQQDENLAEVAFRIALSPSQLRAIEAGDLRPFYSAGYFLQAAERYASFLNIKLPQHATKPATEASISGAGNTQALVSETATVEVSQTESVTEPETIETTTDSRPALETTSPQGRTRAWGWLAFGAAVLIALGILKISFDKPAEAETTSIAAVAPTAENESASASAALATTTPPSAAAPASTTPGAAGPTAATAKTSATLIASAPSASPTPAAAPVVSQDRLANPSSKTVSALASGPSDSQLESQTPTWVQLVRTNGEKTNLKIEPGQKIEFSTGNTAAVVFGQPDKAVLKIREKTINLKPFIATDNPSRALVILNQIRD